ncbi:MAG: DNA polymerase III subunit gamma/tau, partial [Candidatus Omnitrophica bacterium]|nr:DNA polymerase III subunit gamma/tau [Candidatus Omnitrophota bacterium]
MSYLVFARKWRPQNFDEVLGQEHIATTLKNALTLDRVAHAYLFAGPRGIGKTSTARILARALNCEKGPASKPCNRCSFCLEISEGRSLDVIEIDGASNRGIEQVRQLRENVKFAPARSRFKVYIIDEVHQITTDGFNALLKTLEEPPAHIKFIFATTQAHKVLPTILSRCQRFDFKPLSISSIAGKLKAIIKAEKLNVTEEALLYVSRAASGSMRDAESILDQLSSFCKAEINLKTVTSVLGTIDFEALWEISQRIIERKTPEALLLLEKIINEGKDLSQFIAGLMEQFRNILITKVVSGRNAGSLIDLPGDCIGRICEQGKNLTFEELFYIFNVLVRAQENLKRSLSSRVIVEMALVKLTQRENLSSLENILARLTGLEQKLGQASRYCEEIASPVIARSEATKQSQGNPSLAKTSPFIPTLEKGGKGGFSDKKLSATPFDDLKRELLSRKYSYKTVKGYLYYNRDFLSFI